MEKNYKILLLSILFATFFSCDDTLSIDQDEAAKSKQPKKVKVADAGLNEWTGTVPDPCKQVCLVAGQHMYVGTVDVAEVPEGLLVTYNVTEPGIYLEEVHLDIFNTPEAFRDAKKVSNGGAIPGKFEYKKSWSADAMITSHSVLIPTSYIEINIDDLECIFIASHAALSNGETAWGGLCDSSSGDVTNLDEANQFDGANWSVYFQYCLEECVQTIDFTYAWEDLENDDNDADYNDLVIQADVIKSGNQLSLNFLASARGAAYDHEFKIKIPNLGIVNVFGAEEVVDDGTFYYITVFASTKALLPREDIAPYPWTANTNSTDTTCEVGEVEITLTINNNFVWDASRPYEPFITVYPSGTAGAGSFYDLYIWEISKDTRPAGSDTWSPDQGVNVYPNGIIIPRDWNWPYESQIITGPYPDFSPISSWDDDWFNNFDDPSLAFDCD